MKRSLLKAVRLFAVYIAAVLLFLIVPRPADAKAASTEDTQVRHVGGCVILAPRHNQGIADVLAHTCNVAIPAIFEQLGVDRSVLDTRKGAVTIRVVESPQDMQAFSPYGDPLPPWSGAITFPRHNLILLPLERRDGSPNDQLEVTLIHEASHVAFHRVANGAAVPRWFSEGVAILQSEKSSVARKGTIWWASMFNSLPSLESVAHYPEGAAQADNAYAMAADFTASLIELEGWSGIRYLLGMLGEGKSFSEAFDETYGMSVDRAENFWRTHIFGGDEWIAVITGSSVLWGGASILFIAAWVLARRRKKIRLAEMAAEEAPLDQVIATLSAMADEKREDTPVENVDDIDPPALPEPARRRRTMPMRVNIGGRIHTLH